MLYDSTIHHTEELQELRRHLTHYSEHMLSASLFRGLDMKSGLEREIREMKKKRNMKRRTLFQAQDEIDERKDHLLSDIA